MTADDLDAPNRDFYFGSVHARLWIRRTLCGDYRYEVTASRITRDTNGERESARFLAEDLDALAHVITEIRRCIYGSRA